MSGVLYRLLCEEVFRVVEEDIRTEDPGDFSAWILLLPSVCEEAYAEGSWRKGDFRHFPFFLSD